MKKIIQALVVAVVLMSGACASAQDKSAEYENLLDELVAINVKSYRLESTYRESFQPYVDQGILLQSSLEPLCSDLADLARPIMIENAKTTWRSTFSLDDLKAIKEFYDTPTAKKLLGLGSQSTVKAMKMLQDQEMMAKIQSIVQKYVK